MASKRQRSVGDPVAATSDDPSTRSKRMRTAWAVLLAIVVAAVYAPSVTHEFITYDDPAYVGENPHVLGGITWAGVRWAFTSIEVSNWHPLTWLSHMLDCELYGTWAGGHHLTNAILHALSAAVLFLALRQMSGAHWRSLFVAALFGLHPLHVESVAWVAERKDVLSTLFGMLVLWVYAIRADRQRVGRTATGVWYAAALGFFALGLLAKPMLVTLPCVLLLLDLWPLRRWQAATIAGRRGLVVEKLPFVVLSLASSAITLVAQRTGGAVGSVEDFSLPVRVGNAVVAIFRYLGKCFLPVDLAVFYPNFGHALPTWATLLSAAGLVVITAVALWWLNRRPFVAVGWFWYLGTLVPVIGLVQIGGHTIADRYTYLPLTGVFIIIAWSVEEVTRSWCRRRQIVAVACSLAIAVLVVLTSHQLAYWKNTVTLFRHTAAITEDNWVAHHNLHLALARSHPGEAEVELRETLRIIAMFAGSYDARGVEFAKMPGRREDAIRQFRTAIRIMRTLPLPHYHLAVALAQEPEGVPEAIEELKIAVKLAPDLAEAHALLAGLLAGVPGRANEVEAVASYFTALSLNPDDWQTRYELAVLLARLPGRRAQAIEELEKVLRVNPEFAPARERLRELSGRP